MMHLLDKYITSVRLGFATNSSSSHSVLLVPQHNYYDDYDAGDYNWSWFTLASENAKLGYLSQNLYDQVYYSLTKGMPYFPKLDVEVNDFHPKLDVHVNKLIIPSICPKDLVSKYCHNYVTSILEYSPGYNLSGGGVDHQSALNFPLNEDNLPDVDFIKWMKKIFTNPDLVVFGGNDNQESELDVNGSEVDGLLIRESFGDMRVFDRTDHWLLFKKETGFKLRVSKELNETIRYSNVPELVDIKITNACSMGCKFCYQDSVPDGKHSAINYYEIANYLRSLGVLEAAIGGGEPLEYSDFWNLIHMLNNYGIIANVTTRIPNKIDVDKLSQFGGVGYSCESAKIAEAMFKKLGMEKGKYSPWTKKLVLHIVLGATPINEMVKLISLAKEYYVEVLLLSYKDVGRGKDFKPFDYSNIVEVLKENFYSKEYEWWDGPKLGIDTPLVDLIGNDLCKFLNVNEKFMSPGEGNFSLYIDFVQKKMGKSSYGDELFDLSSVDNTLETFNSWHK